MAKLRNVKKVSPEDQHEQTDTAQVVEESPAVEIPASKRQGRGPSKEALARRKRFVRKPRMGRRFVLEAANDDETMRLAWAENVPERVGPLMERGYEPVTGSIDSVSGHILSGENIGKVITKRVGQGKEFILMQVPKEWYDADRATLEVENTKREAALKQQQNQEGNYGKGLKTNVTHVDPDKPERLG